MHKAKGYTLPPASPLVAHHSKQVSTSYSRTILSGLAWLVGIIALLALSLTNEYKTANQHAQVEVENISRVLEEHALATVHKADLMTREVQRNVRPVDMRLARGANSSRARELHALMKSQLESAPEVSVLHVTNALGNHIYSSLDTVPRVNIADRYHFTRHRDDAAAGLVISPPLVSRTTGKWTLILTRRINFEDGSFAGIVNVILDLEYFQQFYRTLNLGTHGLVALYDKELHLAARYPPSEKDMGKKLSSLNVRLYIEKGIKHGVYHSKSPLDGVERLHGFQQVGDFPLIVIAGIAEDDYLAEWRRHTWQYGIGLVILSMVVAGIVLRQRRAEEALSKSEESLRTIAEYTYDWEYWQGPAHEMLFVSPSCERISGYTQAEFIAEPDLLYRIIHPDDRHLMESHVHDIAYEDEGSLDFRIVRRDGETHWIAHGCRAVYGLDGQFLGRRASNRDITERKQIETALRDSEARLTTAQHIAHIGNWELNHVNNRLWWSEEFFRIFEIDSNQFDASYDAFRAVIHPDDRDAVNRAYLDSLENKAPYEIEHRLLFPDGRVKYVHERCETWFDQNGKALRSIGTVQDITERKQAEVALRIAATAFEAQEGMFITDAARVILRVNRAFSDITGYTAEEAVGQTQQLLNSGRHDAAFFAAMTDSIQRSGAWQGEIWNRRKNGEVYPEWFTISAVKGNDGIVTHYVATLTDITARKVAEDEIKQLAFYDTLTRLPNRRLLLDRLRQALATSARTGRHGALLFIDLDNFKTLNDTLGHDIGDLLLQQVALRLVSCVRDGDTVARLGGDEFVVMLEDLSENPKEAATQTKTTGEKILATLNLTYLLAAHDYHGTPSIGATQFCGHQNSVEELLKQTDLAMYQSKEAGRNTLRFFDPDMQKAVTARAAIVVDLRKAIMEKQFRLYYQAQVTSSGRVIGAEALVRWQHPERGLLSPVEFIHLTEETRLILPLGQWVLETACAQLAAWAIQPNMAHLTLAVNVSAHQFRHVDFVDQVLAALDHTGANPQRLKLELTESLLVEDGKDIIDKMTALNEKSVGFSLDDFGTGNSSLAYLKCLPLYQLKIDQSFVRDVLTDPNDAAIARTVVALALNFGLAVIAEGVETEMQRDFLASNSCLTYQGYFFSKPLPLPEFEAFVKRV